MGDARTEGVMSAGRLGSLSGQLDEGPRSAPSRWPRDWVWIALLGFGMVIGGCLAWIVAATRVVLPYDEAFVGLSRAELEAVNGRLLAFLAHDRVTLSGT